MLNHLNTVKKQVSRKLIDEIGLTQHQVEMSIKLAGNSVTNVAQEEASRGNTDGLMHLFSGGTVDIFKDPLKKKIETRFLTKLSSSLDIKGSKATNIKDVVMPTLFSTIAQSIKSSGANGKELLVILQGDNVDVIGAKLRRFFRR